MIWLQSGWCYNELLAAVACNSNNAVSVKKINHLLVLSTDTIPTKIVFILHSISFYFDETIKTSFWIIIVFSWVLGRVVELLLCAMVGQGEIPPILGWYPCCPVVDRFSIGSNVSSYCFSRFKIVSSLPVRTLCEVFNWACTQIWFQFSTLQFGLISPSFS